LNDYVRKLNMDLDQTYQKRQSEIKDKIVKVRNDEDDRRKKIAKEESKSQKIYRNREMSKVEEGKDGKDEKKEDTKKLKTETVTLVDEEGFTSQKKFFITKDEKGNDIKKEYVQPDYEVEEKKTTNKGMLLNNMYEMTKLSGAYEKKNIEQTKEKLKKGQATINNRENQQQLSQNQNQNMQQIQAPKSKKKPKPIHILSNQQKQNKDNKKNTQNNAKKNQNKQEQPVPEEQNKKNKTKDNKKPKQDNKKPEIKQPEKKITKKEKPDNEKSTKKPTKRVFTPSEVSRKDLQKLAALQKKKPKQWYENEYVQPAAIVIICIVLLFTLYSIILSQ